MVDRLVTAATGQPDIAHAWASLVSPNDKVGIKISAAGGELFTTHHQVVNAIMDGLVAAGQSRNKIIVWDRSLEGVKQAGYDPAAAGVPAVSEARTDRLTLAADLNGDGTVAASSEETTAYVCALPAQQLSRIIGRQSLPLAGGVLACGFRYLDATGTPLAVPPAGLDVPDRSRIRAVGLDLTLRLRGTPTTRRVVVALRTSP